VLTNSRVFSVTDPAGSSQPILGLASLRSLRWTNGRRSRSELSFLDQAYDEGYRVMDTAAIYGLGASEEGLGRWMQLRHNRDHIVIISKGGHPSLWRPGRHRISVQCIAKDLSASLRRLRTDYIDLYLLHRDALECELPAVLQYLHDQKQRGTIRTLGASNWHHERIEAANDVARRLGLTEFSVSSPQLSLLSWSRPPWRGCISISGSQGAAARSWYREARIPVLAWSPLGGGLTQTTQAGWTPTGPCYSDPANKSRLARAAAIARAKGITVPQVLMSYLASLSCLVHPICASRKIEHLRANRTALDVKLSQQEMLLLDGTV
jgi:aryl-alcohol dehydrogenase-like predicted oxidoreductase